MRQIVLKCILFFVILGISTQVIAESFSANPVENHALYKPNAKEKQLRILCCESNVFEEVVEDFDEDNESGFDFLFCEFSSSLFLDFRHSSVFKFKNISFLYAHFFASLPLFLLFLNLRR
jgi:hypothetical protein